MNHEQITVEDCLDLYIMKGTRVILEDGQVTGFEEKNP